MVNITKTFIIMGIFLISLVSSQVPTYHQFYGNVTYEDGTPITDLNVNIYLDDLFYAEVENEDGKYGYSSVLFIQGEEGELISFYIGDAFVISQPFISEETTNLNLTLDVAIPPSPSPGGSPGGSSPTTTSKTYTLSESQIEQGYSNQLAEKDRINFQIQSEAHSIKIGEIGPNSVNLNLASTPINFSINIGQEKTFELTSDNYYDLSVKLNNITNNKANITIKKIHEEIPIQAQQTNEDTSYDNVSDDDLPVSEENEDEKSFSLISYIQNLPLKGRLMWGVIALLVFIVIFGCVIWLVRKKLYNSRLKKFKSTHHNKPYKH